ncbi:M23 family metallopeptidase [Sandaracinobacteroides saxicola]|uniref:Peptidoglycan DD-metalloendopeptidase family protein n=1 Tax=Sandaracinobacteroides saxicola TaxID=2759707 RepID=A0A7G5IJ28_9SPHN|nr:peptidoglycan DD-metalloendopeptidase family protein [Sandaracinobacteroides saxicola]QMW23370.1 peptidoglycan DD-metalloendopeptidase family protein [Sandaracinobacteroides saxicola]
MTGGTLALAPSVLPRAPAIDWQRALPKRATLERMAAGLSHGELTVDLGRAIGSALWWRGAATLALLLAGAGMIALRPAAIPGDAPPAFSPAQVEERAADRISPLALGGATGRMTPATKAVERLAEPPERPRIEVTAKLGAVDSIEGALRRAGVGRKDIAEVMRMVSSAANVRRVKPGTEFELVLGRREAKSQPRPLDALAFRAALELRLSITRNMQGTLVMQRIPIKVDETPLRVSGTVGRSLYAAARSAGLPAGVVADYIKQMSYVVDFQREVRGKDRFDMVIEHRRAETGETEMGRLLYAGLVNDGEQVSLMRWGKDGAFWRSNGESAKKGLIKTPIDGARMSSGFGMRLHPVLGYSRLHQGVDFAAPTGTPVMAAAAGRVTFSGWHGGHGNYVRVQHRPGLETAYAHLSRLNVRNGQMVGQGQIIGLVGSTGLSTGPHLHYEVWMNGRAVDPRSARLPLSAKLAAGEMGRFKAQMARLRGLTPAGR